MKLKTLSPEMRQRLKVAAKLISKGMSSGKGLKQICRENPLTMPTAGVVLAWRKKYKRFRAKFDDAYNTHLLLLTHEIDDMLNDPLPKISSIALDEGLYTTGGELDLRAAKCIFDGELAQKKLKLDALKFQVSVLATKYVEELKKKSTVDIKHTSTQYVISSYVQSPTNPQQLGCADDKHKLLSHKMPTYEPCEVVYPTSPSE